MDNSNGLSYLKYSKFKRFIYKIGNFFASLPHRFVKFWVKFGLSIWKGLKAIGNEFAEVFTTFVKGDWKTKISYFIMGFGSLARGQILRGLLFFLFQVIFVLYLVFFGAEYIGNLHDLGSVESGFKEVLVLNPITGKYDTVLEQVLGDNSFNNLLYGVLSVLFILAYIFTWRVNVKQNMISEQILKSGKKLKSSKQDLKSLLDDQFHKTLLALPLFGIVVFTVIPIIFMILIAFTNFDKNHQPPSNLFTWIGFENFKQLLTWTSNGNAFSATFGEILLWTFIWAIFATFTNYFLGMLVAIMINKKGIKLKKMWRTILVVTIAVPQFISLLYVSKMFSTSGIVNGFLKDMNLITENIDFWGNSTSARILVILINIWVGVPYLVLISTGILMNIPQDLYESAKIDGANVVQQYSKITLPYMLFVTGPYLLTSFIGNMNNFNVIYLLTGGAPSMGQMSIYSAGSTDLLVTWLFKLTVDQTDYKLAAVIGIMVFIVVSIVSLIVYNLIPSTRSEEDFQ